MVCLCFCGLWLITLHSFGFKFLNIAVYTCLQTIVFSFSTCKNLKRMPLYMFTNNLLLSRSVRDIFCQNSLKKSTSLNKRNSDVHHARTLLVDIFNELLLYAPFKLASNTCLRNLSLASGR